MPRPTTQSTLAWAEDTALQRCTRSADPRVGVEGRAGALFGSAPVHPFNFNTKATNLRGTTPRHTDTMSPPQLTNADQSEIQFTLNQDRLTTRSTGDRAPFHRLCVR